MDDSYSLRSKLSTIQFRVDFGWGSGGSGVWKDIVKIEEEIDGVGLKFSSSCIGVLGDGRDIRFWVDRWVDNGRLCDRFPRLFYLDRRKEGSVRDKGSWCNDNWSWEWDWVRNIRGRGQWRWRLGEDGEFMVKELTRLIEEKTLHVESGGHETLWNNLVPKKVNIFVKCECASVPAAIYQFISVLLQLLVALESEYAALMLLLSSSVGQGLLLCLDIGSKTEFYLDELELGVTRIIIVMIRQIWDVNVVTGRYLSTDFVLCDAKGNKMHGTARASVAHNFLRLKEGGIYCVKNFAVQPNKDEFGIIKNANFMVEFDGETIQIPDWGQSVRVTLLGGLGETLIEKRMRHVDSIDGITIVSPLADRLYLSSSSSTLIINDDNIPELKQLKTDVSGVESSK
ncbi:reverse transcriptase domain, reverse transcriptase zinc-binding domain protein, partial [Tanacetum coccineum]